MEIQTFTAKAETKTVYQHTKILPGRLESGFYLYFFHNGIYGKVGRTNYPRNRFCKYYFGKDFAKCFISGPFTNEKLEGQLIQAFNTKFKPYKGYEYFIGEEEQMKKAFGEFVEKINLWN